MPALAAKPPQALMGGGWVARSGTVWRVATSGGAGAYHLRSWAGARERAASLWNGGQSCQRVEALANWRRGVLAPTDGGLHRRAGRRRVPERPDRREGKLQGGISGMAWHDSLPPT